MTLTEAIVLRQNTYRDWTCDELKEDARRDILEYLNCITDQLRYDGDTVFAIKALARAVECLSSHHGYEKHIEAKTEMPDWAAKHPEIWAKFISLKDAFCSFMDRKVKDGEAVHELEALFAAHRNLASLVTGMPGVTPGEMAVVANAAKR